MPPEAGPLADPGLWLLETETTFLNHGSFGAVTRAVLDAQNEWRTRMERQPLRFLGRELEPLLDGARQALATFVEADPQRLVFVPNATSGVATVLNSLSWQPGDEILTTDHAYPAVKNVLRRLAERTGARVVPVAVPFVGLTSAALEEAVLAAVTPQTRLAVLDHITSATAVIFPLEHLIPALRARGVETLVDGAHAPGQIPLDLTALGAAYYVGNCHKWLGAPKGAAFVVARPDHVDGLVPLVASRGAYSSRLDRLRLQLEFDWNGTWDPSAVLSIPTALETLGGLLPGGWSALMAAHRALAYEAQGILSAALGITRPVGPELLPAMASISLPPDPEAPPRSGVWHSDFQQGLVEAGFEVPVFWHPAPPERLLRVSAFAYNHRGQYEALGRYLDEALSRRDRETRVKGSEAPRG
jgi:isopenicillin-N epimerase